MAFDFNGSTQWLQYAAKTASMPFSLVVWLNIDVVEAGDVPFCQMADTNSYHKMRENTGGSFGALSNHDSTDVNAASGTTASTGVWTQVYATFVSATSRKCSVNAGTIGTNTDSRNPDAVNNRTRIGTWDGLGNWYDGKLCEASVYTAELAAQDIVALASRFSALLVNTPKLTSHWPFGGAYPNGYIDYVGGRNMFAIVAPVTAAHAPIIYPCDCLSC